MITLKINDLLNSVDTLQKLAKTNLKARTAFAVAKLLKSADAEIQQFNETRMNLIQQYGEKDENGELIKDENDNCRILNDAREDFARELNDLLGTEVEINANKIKMTDLEDIDFTPNDMTVLEQFIDMDE